MSTTATARNALPSTEAKIRWRSMAMPPMAPGTCWLGWSRPAPASTPRLPRLSPLVGGSPRTLHHQPPDWHGHLPRPGHHQPAPDPTPAPRRGREIRYRLHRMSAGRSMHQLTDWAHHHHQPARGAADPGSHCPGRPGLEGRLQSHPPESGTQDRPPHAPTPRRPTRPSPPLHQSRRRLPPARRCSQPRRSGVLCLCQGPTKPGSPRRSSWPATQITITNAHQPPT
jgi:hypothetical protein